MNFYANHRQKGIPAFDDSLLKRLKSGENYVLSPALQRSVDLAIFLGQPLLLTGDPGTGKTALALHLARHFAPDDSLQRFFVFNTKTTSTAQDLFYRYDSLRHFQYIQHHDDDLSEAEVERRFIRYQAMGAAIRSGKRCVVLIDEIDKAPRDFPNDLLDVMDDLSFEVPELGLVGDEKVRTDGANRPIVVLTSNSEKDLPDAFLRRCVFFNIEFPEDDVLVEILERKLSRFTKDQLKAAVEHFREVRNLCKRKQPSTAELLQWVAALEQLDAAGRIKMDTINQPTKEEEEKAEWHGTYGLLVKDREDLKMVLKTL